MIPPDLLVALGQRLLTASWQASLLVLCVLGLRRILGHRLPPKWRHALWWPVLLRLALPLTPVSDFSLYRLVPDLHSSAPLRAQNPSIPPSAPAAPTEPKANNELAANESTPRSLRPITAPQPVTAAPHPSTSSAPVSGIPPATLYGIVNPVRPDPARTTAAVSASASAAAPPPQPTLLVHLSTALAVLWALGVIGVLLPPALGLRRLFSRVRPWSEPRTGGALELWHNLHGNLGIRTFIPMAETRELSGPALLGLLKPVLLLPEGLVEKLSSRELRHVFLHELAHLRRADSLQNGLLLILQALHWFNPVIWYAFRRLRADRELAADALALSHLPPTEFRDYGRTILRLVEFPADKSPTAGLVGILENPDQLADRIESIARHSKGTERARWGWVPVLALGVIGLTEAPTPATATDDRQQIPAGMSLETPLLLRRPPEFRQITNGRSVEIRVIDASTHLPVPLAEVAAPFEAALWGLDPIDAPRWVTDESGMAQLRLGSIPERSDQANPFFALSVRAPGFAPRGHSWSVATGDARESLPSRLTVSLRRGLRLGGKVRDESGHPLAGIRIFASGSGYRFGAPREQDYPEFWRWAHESDAFVTGPDGRWEITDFPQDLERVILECRRPDGMIHRFETENPDQFPTAPPTLDLIALRAGNAALVLPEGHALRGRVLDGQGTPIPGAWVRAGFGSTRRRLVNEVRSDAKGGFHFPHRSPIEWTLTAEAPGFAATSVVVRVVAGLPEQVIQLAPEQPLHLQVTGTDGHGIPGTRVRIDDSLTAPHWGGEIGATDATGRLNWAAAPRGAVVLRIDSPDGLDSRRVRVPENRRDLTIRLDPRNRTNIVVSARTLDVETGQPIRIASVAFRASTSAAFSTQSIIPSSDLPAGGFRAEIPASWFQSEIVKGFQFRVFAPAYGTVVTDWHYFDEGDWEPTILLRRGGALQGWVRTPEGRPAEDAVLSAKDIAHADLYLGGDHRVSPTRDDLGFIEARTDAKGHYAASDPGAEGTFLILHASGFLEIAARDLAARSEVTLQPWGRIEGTLRSEGQPVTNRLVVLRRDTYGRANTRWHCYFSDSTDDAGRFVLTNVPPGDFVLQRIFGGAGAPFLESHPMNVRVNAGQTVRVEYGGQGRSIVGRVFNSAALLRPTGHQLVARTQLPMPARPDREDFATDENWLRSLGPHNEQVNAFFTERRTYAVTVLGDGSFRAEDVAPGVYDLEFAGTDAASQFYVPPRSSGPPYPARYLPYPDRRTLSQVVIVPPRPPPTDLNLHLELLALLHRTREARHQLGNLFEILQAHQLDRQFQWGRV